MCISTYVGPNGFPRVCRKCWQCRLTKVDDLVGRCIAESVTAVDWHVITLTYGRDDEGRAMHTAAAQLQPRDVENMLKLLRVHGYPVRYMIAGEYGGQFGRSHFHCVLVWQKSVPWMPELEKRRRWEWVDANGEIREWWPHGTVYVERPAFEKLRYNLKYAIKETGQTGKEGWLGYSRFPPLGDQYFRERARKIAEQGLAPTDSLYSFADVRKADGELRKFHMSGKTLYNFMTEYVAQWRSLWGFKHFPSSNFLEVWMDNNLRSGSLPSEVAVYKPKRESIQGFVTQFKSNNGETEWLEKPDGITRLPTKVHPVGRSTESYAAMRIRLIKEERKRGSVSKEQ